MVCLISWLRFNNRRSLSQRTISLSIAMISVKIIYFIWFRSLNFCLNCLRDRIQCIHTHTNIFCIYTQYIYIMHAVWNSVTLSVAHISLIYIFFICCRISISYFAILSLCRHVPHPTPSLLIPPCVPGSGRISLYNRLTSVKLYVCGYICNIHIHVEYILDLHHLKALTIDTY